MDNGSDRTSRCTLSSRGGHRCLLCVVSQGWALSAVLLPSVGFSTPSPASCWRQEAKSVGDKPMALYSMAQ